MKFMGVKLTNKLTIFCLNFLDIKEQGESLV